MSKYPNDQTLQEIRTINKKVEAEIQNLDNIIKELQSDSDDENFIEVYSN